MFGFGEYWRREVIMRAKIASGRTLMVSSEAARSDLERLYGVSPDRCVVVPFAIAAPDPDALPEAREVRVRYGLPERFFYLPNQFWKHKNHITVCRALQILRERRREVVVAASGNPADPRNPTLYETLRTFVVEAGIEDSFRFLGMLPHRDLLGLMRASLAVINPSLFEGWSTTVEEAKSFGVPLVLSDLAVHREQAPSAFFFTAKDASALAGLLENRAEELAPGPRPEAEAEARQAAPWLCTEYAHRFEQAVRLALRRRRHPLATDGHR
jgi:glycosyltransferase involved in cell wall biosynthesis